MKNLLMSSTILLSMIGLLAISDSGEKLSKETKATPPEVVCTQWSIWQDMTPCAGSGRHGTKTQRRFRECTDGLTPIGSETPIYRPQYEYRVVECEVLIPILP